MDIKIDIKRLRADIEARAKFGREPGGGISRPSFSQADFDAQAWLKERICKAGLCYRRDGAGNTFGRLGGDGRAVLVGSHIDAAINGGGFDGAAGGMSRAEMRGRVAR